MQIDVWLNWAMRDAERRGLEGLKPLLETLARSTRALRAADDELRERETHAPPQPQRT